MSQSEQKFTRKNGSDRSLSDDFLAALRHSNEVFAAFKVHQMGSDMAAKLLDDNGHLKPFRQWLNDVSSISTHHCGAWLRTEYARRSYEPTTRQTGSPSYATRMSCPTSAGCRQHRLTLSPHTGSIGKRNSPSPSTTRSGPSTTLATDGTASAPSKPQTIPSTGQTTSTASTHRNADSKTTPERMATPSPITTRTSRMVVARVRSTKALKIG